MVEVTVSFVVTDDSGDPVTIEVAIASSEGTNLHEPDWSDVVIDVESGEITLNLRAERDGNGDERLYTITLTATDTSGNEPQTSVTVTVPHDQEGD